MVSIYLSNQMQDADIRTDCRPGTRTANLLQGWSYTLLVPLSVDHIRLQRHSLAWMLRRKPSMVTEHGVPFR